MPPDCKAESHEIIVLADRIVIATGPWAQAAEAWLKAAQSEMDASSG